MITSTGTPSPSDAQWIMVPAEGVAHSAARPRPQDLVPPPARIGADHTHRLAVVGLMSTLLGTCLVAEFDETEAAHSLGFGLIVGGLASIASVIGRTYFPNPTANQQ